MTASTGKRSYRACVRCRRRKIRCDFDGVGELKKAPCVSFYFSGSKCILAESRRGGNFRRSRPVSKLRVGQENPRPSKSSDSLQVAFDTSRATSSSPVHSSNDGESVAEQTSGDVLAMELRNPSDALQILARSGEAHSPNHTLGQSLTVRNSNNAINELPQNNEIQRHRKVTTAIFDDYELVQRGLLRPCLISELLLTYYHKYHPYFPIVPSSFLVSPNIVKIQRSDYFLLTAILAIASRDDPHQSLTHRYCWDHAQHLLTDVLLAHPWTQTPRTVVGLLLLAEWLPHIQIQETTSEVSSKNLFSEERTAWSLVGLAVRQGYLQRLDQGAFRNSNNNESKERIEENRLIWAYIFMADRQISVRLGQSFWSRGPSLAAKFTAKDFPSLQPHPESDTEDYASVLQASMELTQILHNAHAILYSSKERTMAMVHEGHYSRYLDDFKNAATTWHSTWSNIAVSTKIRNTLMIMYEYICLYTNAFSLQAVLTRASAPYMSSHREQQSKQMLSDLFSGGIMSSADGQYIMGAITAAINLLGLMNSLDPRHVLCYLPSRYYLYGVYAAVLLHKADCAGAFQTGNQRQEITSLARKFVTVLGKAPSTELHICHNYSRMLKQLWGRFERRPSQYAHEYSAVPNIEPLRGSVSTNSESRSARKDNRPFLAENSENFNVPPFFNSPEVDNTSAVPSIECYLLGSFMPGVADFDGALGSDYPLVDGLQDWATTQPEMNRCLF